MRAPYMTGITLVSNSAFEAKLSLFTDFNAFILHSYALQCNLFSLDGRFFCVR